MQAASESLEYERAARLRDQVQAIERTTERQVREVRDRTDMDVFGLAREEQEANVRSAEANVQAAEAQLRQATSTFERQRTLLAQGFTTRATYDQAEQQFRTAQGSLDASLAQLETARQQWCKRRRPCSALRKTDRGTPSSTCTRRCSPLDAPIPWLTSP